MQHKLPQITGRFAPTPSGPLHFGSLVSAVASYCHARSNGGQWLLRIEDVDTPRVVKGASEHILHTLQAFGFEWDGPVIYQSRRFPLYEEILQHLISQKYLYRCSCSRKQLNKQNLELGPLGRIYPGSCRNLNLRNPTLSLRLNVESAGTVDFIDAHYGNVELNLPDQVGDVVLKRVDGVYAYHLAVVIDDHEQRVNQIVRGSDLLKVSTLHHYLYRLLAYPVPEYLHIPVVNSASGEKLSKQTGAKGLVIDKASIQLADAAHYLGQEIPRQLTSARPYEILQYMIQHWNPLKIPAAN